MSTSSITKQTRDLDYAHSLTSMQYRLPYTCPEPKQPSQKPTLYKVRVVFSVHAVRAGGVPHGANHGPLTAKPSSPHVHVTLQVIPPTFPCPTLSAQCAVSIDQENFAVKIILQLRPTAKIKHTKNKLTFHFSVASQLAAA